MPIHLRANPGDYAEACLLPGDPLRAKYIAETYFADAKQVNGELIQLGVKTLIRVGTCGGLQLGQKLGDTIVAISGVSADSTAAHLVGNEPHAPTASWELSHAFVHAAEAIGQPVHVGPVASSDLFYNPDQGQYERWSKRGVLAVEMEAAALFTVAALRGVRGGCLLLVSDMVIDGTFMRISDAEMKAAVHRMTRIALAVATGAKPAVSAASGRPRAGDGSG